MAAKFIVSPWRCEAPHAITHPEKLDDLTKQFRASGWDFGHPALIGYENEDGTIQLLSGTHRIEAAKRAQLTVIPMVLYKKVSVYNAQGSLGMWRELMNAGDEMF